VKHYSTLNVALLHQAHIYVGEMFAEAVPTDTVLKPLNLSEQEIDDVVAFLESLTEREHDRKPAFVRKPVPPCR